MIRDTFTEIERARSALWSLDAGTDRDTWVKTGMAAKAAGLDFDDFHDWSAGAGNYKNEAECRSVWQSIKDGGIGPGSLFGAARAVGWTDGDEAPAKRPQSHQEKRQQPEASSKPPFDPRTIWDACKPATAEQAYVKQKLGLPDGLRIYDGPLTIAGIACAGSLVLPCSTLDGELVTLQFITPQGKKLFLPGCKLSPWPDACLIVGGPLKRDGAAYIVEGAGQAWSAHQATRAPAVVAFGVGRMAGIVRALRQRYPAARLVVVPDVGKEDQAAAIAKDVHGAWLELPPELGQNGDLNDLHQRDGLPAVAALLARAKATDARRPGRAAACALACARRATARRSRRGVRAVRFRQIVFGAQSVGGRGQRRRVVRLPGGSRASALRRPGR